jgi:predicted ArsR family transcriptional regulator
MDTHSPDRAEQIAGVAALSDPVRRALYDYVVAQGRDVGRDEAAQAAGISRNLASFHLDKLVEEGLLETIYRRLTGRTGPGAGRPSKLYRRSGRHIDLSLPPRSYELAARLFAVALAEEDVPDVRNRLRDVAFTSGARLGQQARQTMDRSDDESDLMESTRETLRKQGYEPYDADDGSLRLRNCPFHELSQDYRQLVCGTNLCLLQGLAAGLGRQAIDVTLDPRPGECCVVFRNKGVGGEQSA